MNLVIDIGNTRIKAGLYQEHRLLNSVSFAPEDEKVLEALLNSQKPEKMIISTVVKELPLFMQSLKNHINCLEFTSKTPIPVINCYESASTLGSDRLAAAVGGWKYYPGEDLLVIDSGTCIKYNFINSRAEYLGGAISPGIDMRLKALHEFTGRLPLLDADYKYSSFIGKNTRESLLSGVMIGALEEMEGMINRYETQYPGLKVVLTGGNHHFFEKQLKKRIFAHPNLVLEGLNEILVYNARI